ncbi:MAG: hypothetical protein QNK05_05095 [Myxococcota bacterium]|nr:hypothetical protein [Myxococcota bacterium]
MLDTQTIPRSRNRLSPQPVGPAHLARQIDAAGRLAPAEAVRGQRAMLLTCGKTACTRDAEEVLGSRFDLDVVHHVRCPFPSWQQALREEPGTLSWLSRYLGSALAELDPDLVAILDAPDGQDADLRVLAERLRSWGAVGSMTALRVLPDGEVDFVFGAPSEGVATIGRLL